MPSENYTRTVGKPDMAQVILPANDDISMDVLVDNITVLADEIAPKYEAEITPLPSKTELAMRLSGRALFLGDLVALAASFVIGGVLSHLIKISMTDLGFQGYYSVENLMQFLVFMGLGGAALLWLDQQGHYRQRLPYWEVLGHIVALSTVGIVVGGFIQFAMKNDFSRLWLGLSWVLLGVCIFAARGIVRRMMTKADKWELPVLIVGDGATAAATLRALRQEKEMGYNIVAQATADEVCNLVTPGDWVKFMAARKAGYILIALEGSDVEACQPMVQALVRAQIPYSIVPPWLGLPSSGLSPHSFFTHDILLLHNTNRLTLPLPRLMKRSFDIIVSASALLLLAPAFLAVALLARRDGGPAFVRNERIGLNGKRFDCFKFRSMVMDNDKILRDYLAHNPAAAEEWNKFQKLAKDPRITKFGAFIRRTSIDELPQLINVLKGDMSLVGPRPILPSQRTMYGNSFSFYTAVRPGITGPWQVSGRNKLTIAQRVALESWYARNWSMWMDIVVLLKTVPTVLGKDSAAF